MGAWGVFSHETDDALDVFAAFYPTITPDIVSWGEIAEVLDLFVSPPKYEKQGAWTRKEQLIALLGDLSMRRVPISEEALQRGIDAGIELLNDKEYLDHWENVRRQRALKVEVRGLIHKMHEQFGVLHPAHRDFERKRKRGGVGAPGPGAETRIRKEGTDGD